MPGHERLQIDHDLDQEAMEPLRGHGEQRDAQQQREQQQAVPRATGVRDAGPEGRGRWATDGRRRGRDVLRRQPGDHAGPPARGLRGDLTPTARERMGMPGRGYSSHAALLYPDLNASTVPSSG